MTLKQTLVAAIGPDAVSDDAALRTLMAHDVYRGSAAPALVVRPTTVAGLQAAVRICAAAGVAMVPRGGGASYTDGYLHDAGGHVLFDIAGLDDIDIDVDNALVTVGAGVSWARLRDALAAHGLRTPFWGPFSGLAATVGGSVSQNTLSHGSSAYGLSAESIVSMDVVLASGELLTTSPSKATRHYGPDLTGLFTGDCGALGIKATIRLPLIAAREAFEAVTFAFDDFASFHQGVRHAQREKLDDSHFGLDLALSQGQIGRQAGVGARLRIAAEIVRNAPATIGGKAGALRQLVRMAMAGDDAMRAGAYMCHFIIEGVDQAEASARAKRLRAVIAPYGRETANSVPSFVRALPFAPLTNILGPGGERWVPLHGVFRHSDVLPFHDALQAFYETRAAEMTRLGVWAGTMFSPVGSSGFLYEIALYWPDARTVYHPHMLTPEHLATQPDFPDNAEVRDYADRLKRDIVDLFQRHGAAHFQIGRTYPYRDRLDPQASMLVQAIKTALDPQGLMNPGVLGL